MKPSPWTQESVDPAEREAASALAGARSEPEPWSAAQERAALDGIRARLAPRPAWRPVAVGFFATAAAMALVLVGVRHRQADPARPVAAVEATAQADYALVPAGPGRDAVLSVKRGEVRVHGAAPARFTLELPGLKGHVDARVFRVQAAGALSTLEVVEGSAELLSRDGRAVRINQGQTITSDDMRLQATKPGLAPDPCAGQGAVEVRRACYLRASAGDDLAAQNAILELGLLEQEEARNGAAALEAWRGYQRRFPTGPLGPEASVAILGELLAERRYDDARGEADRFLTQYPQDGRAAEVRRTRDELKKRLGP
jgi:hypothetical protein